MYKCQKFSIKELVSKQVYQKFGESSWMFFDEDILKDLDTIRLYHGSPIIINNWASGGNFSQCGLRCNKDPLIVNAKGIYCTAHIMGKAFDLHSNNIKKLYDDIQYLFNQGKLKAIKRMESSKSTKFGWCHVDSFQTNSSKLVIFSA